MISNQTFWQFQKRFFIIYRRIKITILKLICFHTFANIYKPGSSRNKITPSKTVKLTWWFIVHIKLTITLLCHMHVPPLFSTGLLEPRALPHTVLCIAVKVAVFYEIDSKLWLFWLPYASLCLGNYLDQFFEKFLVDWWPFYLTEPDESPLVEEKVKKTPFLSLVKQHK